MKDLAEVATMLTEEMMLRTILTVAEAEEVQGVCAREQAGTAQDPLIPPSLPSFYEWD